MHGRDIPGAPGGEPLTRPRLGPDPSLDELEEVGPVAVDFFARPVIEVARDLLGTCIVSTIDGLSCAGVVVETEAYGGPSDPASHAATVSGVTRRNRAMFGPPGRAYVYRSYGVHWCLNLVTGRDGEGEAVLLRGILPVQGEEVMLGRRGRRPLGVGPGRLAQALGVTDGLYGHDLTEPPLLVRPGWRVPDERVAISGRVGIKSAADWPRRFYVRDCPGVSRRRGDRPHHGP